MSLLRERRVAHNLKAAYGPLRTPFLAKHDGGIR